MPHKISVLVRADVARESITLEVSGHLSLQTMPILERHVRRARTLDPAAPVRVDLASTDPIDPVVHSALSALTESAGTEGPFVHGGRVVLVGVPVLSETGSSGVISGEVTS